MPLNMLSREKYVGKAIQFSGSINKQAARKSSDEEKLPKIRDEEDRQSEEDREKKSLPQEMEGRQLVARRKSTNIPPLPSIHKVEMTMKYPLASKYFNKWQTKQKRASSSNVSMGADVIDEEGGNNCEILRNTPIHLFTRFPSSPEFATVFQSIFDKDKD